MILKLCHRVCPVCVAVILRTRSFTPKLPAMGSWAAVCGMPGWTAAGRQHGRAVLKKTWLVSGMPGNSRTGISPRISKETSPEAVVRGWVTLLTEKTSRRPTD